MTAFGVIQSAAAADLIDEDSNRIVWKPRPGLVVDEIDRLEHDLGFPLPGELRDLLSNCAGVEGPLDDFDFTGRSMAGQGPFEIFPRVVPIAGDGFGNFWQLDAAQEPAPIYFACHDPPTVLYQSESIAAFLREAVRMYHPPHRSLINDVHGDRLFDVWRQNPGTITRAEAALRDDALREFAATLDDRFTIVDLRHARPGMGFSWGRYGADTELRRHGDLPIFAYAAPPK